jgi:hypothetical protein
MVALMPAKPKKKEPTRSRGLGTKDVFARLQEQEVDELDRIVKEITPATSRAAVIAMLIRQYIAGRQPKGRN